MNLLVDCIVGNQSSEMLSERYIDEQTSAALGGVKVLRKGTPRAAISSFLSS
jgi:hypothetical protein